MNDLSILTDPVSYTLEGWDNATFCRAGEFIQLQVNRELDYNYTPIDNTIMSNNPEDYLPEGLTIDMSRYSGLKMSSTIYKNNNDPYIYQEVTMREPILEWAPSTIISAECPNAIHKRLILEALEKLSKLVKDYL
jgi:hypothetical protein